MNEDMRYFNNLPTPTLRITSRFGRRNTGIAGASTNHKGIDLGGNGGETPIFAVRRGRIAESYWNDIRGWVVVIEHSKKYRTLYQHLRERSPLPVGAYVMAGERIGTMGNSSKRLKIATHLHMELHENGKPIDPEPWLLDIRGIEDDMTEAELKNFIDQSIRSALIGTNADASTWAASSWAAATNKGIVDGKRPQGYVTREQAVLMIERALKKD